MGWGLRVIIPERVVYVDYSGESSVKDVSEALQAVLREVEKRSDPSQTFYCVSGVGETASGRSSINQLNDAFRAFRDLPTNTTTILITDDRLTGFIAGLVHSMRNLGFKHERSIAGAIRQIASEDAALAAQLSPDDFYLDETTEETTLDAD